MNYIVSNCKFRLKGERIELSAYQPNNLIKIIAEPPKDDEKYINIGQAPNSNFLNPDSSNISQLNIPGIDTTLLKETIEKLNNILKDNFYAEDISAPKLLKEAIDRQKGACFYDLVTFGAWSKMEYKKHTKKFVVAFNQRRYFSLVQALIYIKSINKVLQQGKLVIGIPRSFPAYISVSNSDENKESLTLNENLLKELQEHPELATDPLRFNKKTTEPGYRATLSIGVASPRSAKKTFVVPSDRANI